jgi:hypothetical protein
MAGRSRSTKKLAQRINLDYFKTQSGMSRWRRTLTIMLSAVGLGWLAWYAFAGSPKPYDAGPLAHAHALLGTKCTACHVSAAAYQRSATDAACLSCHDGPIHHADQTFTPSCSDCHVEHQGAVRLASVSDRSCTQCHSDLRTQHGPAKFAAKVASFASHPDFSAIHTGAVDPGTIKFSHRVHLKTGLRGPQGPVELQCEGCHQPSGRTLMAPVSYEKHCVSCHPLEFDRRFSEAAPHKAPQVVYNFVAAQLTTYIAAHPAEISLVDQSDKRLPARPPQPPACNAAEWVSQRLADAQVLLWRKSCIECHSLSYPNGSNSLPVVAKSALPSHWFEHARFDHRAHRMVECSSCHAKARESDAAADVLIPGVENCRQCHRSGVAAAESRCFECHTYHDWSQEKPAAGKYVVKQFAE